MEKKRRRYGWHSRAVLELLWVLDPLSGAAVARKSMTTTWGAEIHASQTKSWAEPQRHTSKWALTTIPSLDHALQSHMLARRAKRAKDVCLVQYLGCKICPRAAPARARQSVWKAWRMGNIGETLAPCPAATAFRQPRLPRMIPGCFSY